MTKDTGERYSPTPTPDVTVRHSEMVSSVATSDILIMPLETIMAQAMVPSDMTPKEAQQHREDIATKRLPELMRDVDKLFSLVLRESGVKRDVDESPEDADPETVIKHAISSLERVAAPYGVPVQKSWFELGNIFRERQNIVNAIETAIAASLYFSDTPQRRVEELSLSIRDQLRAIVKELALLKTFYKNHGVLMRLEDHVDVPVMDFNKHQREALVEGGRRSSVIAETERLFVEKGFLKLSADELRETIRSYEMAKANFEAARNRLLEPSRRGIDGVAERIQQFDERLERDWVMLGFLEHRLRDVEAGRAIDVIEAPSEAVTAPGGSGKPAEKPYQMPRDVPPSKAPASKPSMFTRFGGTVRAAMIGLTTLMGVSDRPVAPEVPRAEPTADVTSADMTPSVAEEEQVIPMRQLVDVKATVVAGDTVWAIAKRRLADEGMTNPKKLDIATKMSEIIAINHLSSDGDIAPGQELVVARELVTTAQDEAPPASSKVTSVGEREVREAPTTPSPSLGKEGWRGDADRNTDQDAIELANHETIWSTARAMLEAAQPGMRISNERVELVTALMLEDSNIKASQSLSLKPGTSLNVARTRRVIAELAASSKPNLREIALREDLGWPPNVLRRFKR